MMRTSALMAVVPAFSMPNVPVKIRIALGALTAFFVSSTHGTVSVDGWPFIQVVILMTSEVFVGLMLGFVSRFFFYALDIAGSLIANGIGLMMSMNFNPFQSSQSTLPASILYQLAIMIFFSLDMHHWFFVGLSKSFEVLPIGQADFSGDYVNDVVSMSSGIFSVGIMIAGPILTVSFVLLLLFSFLGRAVPQMNVFAESFSFRILSGLIVFGMTIDVMAEHIVQFIRGIPLDLMKAANGLAG
jgi:flagellar biosynthetic protein FliR